ncbi:MAG: ABC transporter ATP-binding protein [candidate division WWE3 bacterium]|nr:ABC transporter ATP-binding protein [candidate division WWE3 bacterium]
MVKVTNLNKTYILDEVELRVLKDINLTINAGEMVAIMGKSGSGKSTLMHIIGCLDKPSSGEIFINKQNTAKLSEDKLAEVRNKEIGFVFQAFNLLSRTSSIDNVELPLIYAGIKSKKRNEMAKEALTEVGLADKLHNKPSQLSGGQQQRVAIARALVTNPSLILADEPTGNLDSKAGEEVMTIFKNLNAKGRTIIIVTHDEEVARQAQRIIHIQDGKIVN